MYTLTTVHNYTAEEMQRATHFPAGMKRSVIEARFSNKAEALLAYEIEVGVNKRLGISDSVTLITGKGKVLASR